MLEAEDITENNNIGKDMPIPNAIKFSILTKNSITANALAKRAAINDGLHGITIAPKKNPNTNIPNREFLTFGVLTFGKYLPTSIFNINNMLIINNIKNAIGDIIPIIFVKDTCKNVVNINPNKNINVIMPRVIINPDIISNPLLNFLEILLER